jgi:hypothetical protein
MIIDMKGKFKKGTQKIRRISEIKLPCRNSRLEKWNNRRGAMRSVTKRVKLENTKIARQALTRRVFYRADKTGKTRLTLAIG